MTAPDIPVVHLAGRDWPIPKLAVKQNRVVTPAITKMLPQLGRFFAATEALAQGDGAALLPLEVSQETFDLMSDAVYAALTRATPGLARAEFDNLPISFFDLISALAVVVQQSGSFKHTAPGDTPTGEAPATVNPSTSISSSPIIVSAPENPGLTS
jgi:hypothetical protein